jgi:carbamoyl-phosphate synthase large subunit
MNTILITAIGGDIAQGVATIIREEYPHWRLIGMDIHKRHGGSLFVDKLYTAPAASESNYDDWLKELIHKEKVNFCIPMSEAELLHFAQQRQNEVADISFVMPNSKAVEVGCDKLETSIFLESVDCPRPWTISTENAFENTPLPCIFKPRRSAGSKSIFVCHTHQEIAFYRERYPAAILQELLMPADKEVTCAIYRTQDGRTAVLQLLRELVGGFTGWARVIKDDMIDYQCIKLAEGLDLKGAINVQLRITDKGPRIFEINPRFSSTILIRHRMGFQDVVWALQECMHKKIDFQFPPVGTTGVRLQGAAVLSNRLEGNSI